MLAVWNRYDEHIEEAARDLGANVATTFREVTLPLVWTGIFGAALFGFTLTWNDFDRTVLLVLDNTLPLADRRPDPGLGDPTRPLRPRHGDDPRHAGADLHVLIVVTIRLRLRGRRVRACRGGARPRGRDRRRGRADGTSRSRDGGARRGRLDRRDDHDASRAGHGQARSRPLWRRARRDARVAGRAAARARRLRQRAELRRPRRPCALARASRARARGAAGRRAAWSCRTARTPWRKASISSTGFSTRTPRSCFTGAQRGADQPDADGPRNLRDAIRLAVSDKRAVSARSSSSPAKSMRAVRLVRSTRVPCEPSSHPASVRSATSTATPSSSRRSPVRSPALPLPERLAVVDLHRLYAGSDGRFIRHSLDTGAEALVLEGTGRGNANDQVVEAVREASSGAFPSSSALVARPAASSRCTGAAAGATSRRRARSSPATSPGRRPASSCRSRSAPVSTFRRGTGSRGRGARLRAVAIAGCCSEPLSRCTWPSAGPPTPGRGRRLAACRARRRTRRSRSTRATTRSCWRARTACSRARSASTARPTAA